MGFDPFHGALARPGLVKRGRDFTEQGFFSELDKENLLKMFCTTSMVENILVKYFHQVTSFFYKARGGVILKIPNPK